MEDYGHSGRKQIVKHTLKTVQLKVQRALHIQAVLETCPLDDHRQIHIMELQGKNMSIIAGFLFL